MNVLIVDDQYEGKVKQIARKINSLENSTVRHVTNTKEAFSELCSKKFDLIIVDLQIPEGFGEDIDVNGGLNLIKLISEEQEVNIPNNIVGVTSHLESYNSNRSEFMAHGWVLHLYEGDNSFIDTIIENIHKRSRSDLKFDVAFITALRHIEFDALLQSSFTWTELCLDDCTKYYSTEFKDKDGFLRTAVATYCPSMGMPVSSAITMKLIKMFKPKLVIMTGIAAGVEGKVNFGDILIPNQIWDWGSGKTQDAKTGTKLLSDPEIVNVNEQFSIEMKDISAKGLYVDEIKRNFQGNVPQSTLSIHIGPLASGASVLADSKTISLIKEQKRSVIGVEMEAYGVLIASKLSGFEPTKALVIKSVCDFANSEKSDSWQKYAAYTSVAVAQKVIQNHINFEKI